MNTDKNIRMAVLFGDNTKHGVIDTIINQRLRDYHVTASYAVSIIQNPANYEVANGQVSWKHSIEIVDDTHCPVAWHSAITNTARWDTVIEGTNIYPAVRYILQAVSNAKNEVINSQ